MALVVADRVKETTTTTGTGAITLAGAAANFATFSSVLSNGDTTYYAIVDDANTDFEVGLGTYATSGNTLTRTTVLASSNSGSAVNLSAGIKEVFINYPAGKSVYLNGSGQLVIGGTAVTATTAELNILDGVTATTAELNYVDGVTSNIQTQIDNISPSPTLTATASGALANGDTVIVNSNGTVSAIVGSDVTQAIGSETVFESASTQYISSVYDANAQKIVVAYSDGGNSDYGTAVVGTVSGTSITFGTPVVYRSAGGNYEAIAYDANAQKVVIGYKDSGNSNYGTAIVGTVSGTSISFGTAVVFKSRATDEVSITYDTSAQKVLIAYKQLFNYYGEAIVGTVSGTSISFGSEAVFNSANTTYISSAYDSNAGKHVIVYKDEGNSGYGTAVVATVSGTSVSFGSETVFKNARIDDNGVAYDSNAQKVVIAWRDYSNSFYGTSLVGTVVGTGMTFGTAVVFESARTDFVSVVYDPTAQKTVIGWRDAGNASHGKLVNGTVSGTSISFDSSFTFHSAETQYISTSYDSNAGKVVIVYRDGANSDYGSAAVYTTPYGSTNLTAENYIGISNAAYSDGASATIQIVGAVDDAQSSLTAGQQYFVQIDGSLGLTAGNPSVIAGTAVSATKLIIKG